jgi:hypothetical protein
MRAFMAVAKAISLRASVRGRVRADVRVKLTVRVAVMADDKIVPLHPMQLGHQDGRRQA